jgi:tripartite-type tricarboxylate transporter receptor subunit TctC
LTLLLGSTANLTINPSLYQRVGFDTLKDFEPISLLAVAPNVLVVNPTLPVRSVAELIALAKTKPGQLRFASGGNGSTGHLAGELFQQAAQVQFLHVPYRGGPQAVTDLIGGQVDLLFFTVPSVLPHVTSGRIKALAVTSPRRSPVLPELPTIAEAGMKEFDASPWFGLLAPAGTPKAVVDRLAQIVATAWNDDEVKAKLAQQGAEPVTNSPAAFAALLKSDLQRWTAAVKRSGVTIE